MLPHCSQHTFQHHPETVLAYAIKVVFCVMTMCLTDVVAADGQCDQGAEDKQHEAEGFGGVGKHLLHTQQAFDHISRT